MSLVLCRQPGQSCTPGGGIFVYEGAMRLDRLIPSSGPIRGLSRITLVGQGFHTASTCRFAMKVGNHTIRVFSSSLMLCMSPRLADAGVMTVDVVSGAESSESRLAFLAFQDPVIDQIVPSTTSIYGGALMTVLGRNFLPLGSASCLFGAVQEVAELVDEKTMTCRTPLMKGPGVVAVKVSSNGIDFDPIGWNVTFAVVPRILHATPSLGSVHGGTRVRLEALDMGVTAQTYCWWDAVPTVISEGIGDTVECTSPPHAAGVASLRIGSAADLRSADCRFIYVEEPVIYSLVPTFGGLEGGSTVTISGAYFLDGRMFCRFGSSNLAMMAQYWSSSSLACVTPPMDGSRVVGVRVSVNDVDVGSELQSFLYTVVGRLHSVGPTVGPVAGGTTVTVHASGLRESGTMQCRFGADDVMAVFISSTALSCVSPQRMSEANVSFSVLHDDTELPSVDRIRYAYENTGVILSMFPRRGPTQGGTTLMLDVGGLRYYSGLKCVIGGRAVSAEVRGSLAYCATPAHPTGTVYVEVYNGRDRLSGMGLSFEYVKPPVVFSLSPCFGERVGGTLVSVVGLHFEASPDGRCRFGEAVVRATVVSPTLLHCSAPAQSGMVVVEISLNGVDFTARGMARYLYLASADVFNIVPSQGDTQKGMIATVYGRFFHASDSLACRFNGDISVRGVYVSSSAINLIMPPLPDGSYRVTVSNNGVDHSLNFSTFRSKGIPKLLSVSPSRSRVSQARNITVKGTGFLSTTPYWCQFGAHSTRAHYVSERSLRCMTPASSSTGTAKLAISGKSILGDRELLWGTIDFEFYVGPDDARIRISPTLGAITGGTLIEAAVPGINITAVPPECRFSGTIYQPGTITGASRIQCYTPKHGVGLVHVEVGVEGMYLPAEGGFLFTAEAEILALEPSIRAAASEAAVITVQGRGFRASGDLACRVGGSQRCDTQYLSASLLLLKVEALLAGNNTVQVSNNGVDFAVSGILYDVRPVMRVFQVIPTIGAASGGQHVRVRGEGMRAGFTLACYFGTERGDAELVSDTEIECQTPSHKSGRVQVTVMLNSVVSEGAADFVFVEPYAQIVQLLPSSACFEVGTIVSVIGSGFAVENGACMVAGQRSPTIHTTSSTQVSCRLPKLPEESSVVAIEVLGSDGLFSVSKIDLISSLCAFSNGLSDLLFYSDNSHLLGTIPVFLRSVLGTNGSVLPGLQSISMHPTCGPSKAGFYITLTGFSFLVPPVNYSCSFSLLGQKKTISPASIVSSTKVVCCAPSFVPDRISIEPNQRSMQMLDSGLLNLSQPDVPEIFSLSPTSGPVDGGVPVNVSGLNFVAGSMLCVFGNSKSIPALVLSSTLLRCIAPTLHQANSDNMTTVAVEVSSNSADFTQSGLTFEYVLRARVLWISPKTGFAGIADNITVHGSFREVTGGVRCKWGASFETGGSLVSSSAVLCPYERLGRGNYTVEVAMPGGGFSTDGVEFEVVGFVTIKQLVPSSGPVDGMVPIRVFISGPHPSGLLECVFGTRRVVGVTVSDGEVVCAAPAGEAGISRFVLSSGTEESKQPLYFEYVEGGAPTVELVRPSIGDPEGGTAVEIVGRNLVTRSAMARFATSLACLLKERPCC